MTVEELKETADKLALAVSKRDAARAKYEAAAKELRDANTAVNVAKVALEQGTAKLLGKPPKQRVQCVECGRKTRHTSKCSRRTTPLGGHEGR